MIILNYYLCTICELQSNKFKLERFTGLNFKNIFKKQLSLKRLKQNGGI